MIGVMPTGRNPETGKQCVSLFWSMKTADYAAWKGRPLSEWQAQILGYWPEIAPVVTTIPSSDEMLLATYSDVRMRRWHEGNVVVLGDAAHGMSPQLGQGANLALIDAMVLAESVEEHASLTAAFAAYSEKRRRHLGFYQFASRWLTPLFQSQSRAAGWLRDQSFPLASRIPFIRRHLACTVAGLKTGILSNRPVMDMTPAEESADGVIPGAT